MNSYLRKKVTKTQLITWLFLQQMVVYGNFVLIMVSFIFTVAMGQDHRKRFFLRIYFKRTSGLKFSKF